MKRSNERRCVVLRKIVAKMLIFIIVVCSIIPSGVIFASQYAVEQPLTPDGEEILEIVPDATQNPSAVWEDCTISSQSEQTRPTLKFKLSGNGETKTYKLPIFNELENAYGYSELYYNDSTTGLWEPLGFSKAAYDDEEISEGDRDVYKVIKTGVEYRIVILDSSLTASELNSRTEFTTLNAEFYDDSNEIGYVVPSDAGPAPGTEEKDVFEEEEPGASIIERILAVLLIIIGDGVFRLIGLALGETVSIDSLLFNGFSKTRLTFFGKDTTNSVLNIMKTQLTTVFGDFRNIALTCYLVILVYMAIRILLNSTAGQRSQYKELFMYWMKGIVILFFFPYIIDYTIQINNAIVKYIGDNRAGILKDPTYFTANINSKGSITDDFDYGGENALGEGKDYMTIMRDKAYEKGWIAYSICFLVMIWQVVAFIIIYYKRMLIIMFLIAIFPLVTISYAVDKVGDGKSQAFDNWFKEFFLNVFLQTFHAITYVLVMGVVFNLSHSNWILIVIAITFVSKGDVILRKIFGQEKGGGAETVKTVATTALAAYGSIELAKKATATIKKNFTGENSRFHNARKYMSEVNLLKRQRERALSPIMPNMDEEVNDDENDELIDTPENRTEDINAALGAINDANVSPEELSNALSTLNRYRDTEEYNQLTNGMNQNELDSLIDQNNAVTALKHRNSLDDLTINQKLSILIKNKREKGGKPEGILYDKIRQNLNMTDEEIKETHDRKSVLTSVRVGLATAGYTVASQGRFTVRKSETSSGSTTSGAISEIARPGISSASSTNTETSGTAGDSGLSRAAGGGSYRGSSSGPAIGVSGSSSTESRRLSGSSRVGGSSRVSGPSRVSGSSRASVPISDAARTKETLENRRERIVESHQREASGYIKDAVGASSDKELLNKMRYTPVNERRSLRAVSNAVSRINHSNQGVYNYNDIAKSIKTFKEESTKPYKQVETISKQLKYDIDEFETNWAVETINNHDKIEGTKEEKQEIIDQAIRVIKSNKDKGKVYSEIISKSLADVNSLEEGEVPIRKKTASPQNVSDEYLNQVEFSDGVETPPVDIDLLIAQKEYEAKREALKGVLGVIGGTVSTFTMAAGGASSGSGSAMVNMGLIGTNQGVKLGDAGGWVADKLHRGSEKEYNRRKEELQKQVEDDYTYEAHKLINNAREAGRRAGEESIKEKLIKNQRMAEQLKANGHVVLVDKDGKIAIRKANEKK
jgi:hypothetical protein